MKKLLVLLLLFAFSSSFSQDFDFFDDEDTTECPEFFLGVPNNYTGLCFGNSKVFSGIRINTVDCGG